MLAPGALSKRGGVLQEIDVPADRFLDEIETQNQDRVRDRLIPLSRKEKNRTVRTVRRRVRCVQKGETDRKSNLNLCELAFQRATQHHQTSAEQGQATGFRNRRAVIPDKLLRSGSRFGSKRGVEQQALIRTVRSGLGHGEIRSVDRRAAEVLELFCMLSVGREKTPYRPLRMGNVDRTRQHALVNQASSLVIERHR